MSFYQLSFIRQRRLSKVSRISSWRCPFPPKLLIPLRVAPLPVTIQPPTGFPKLTKRPTNPAPALQNLPPTLRSLGWAERGKIAVRTPSEGALFRENSPCSTRSTKARLPSCRKCRRINAGFIQCGIHSLEDILSAALKAHPQKRASPGCASYAQCPPSSLPLAPLPLPQPQLPGQPQPLPLQNWMQWRSNGVSAKEIRR